MQADHPTTPNEKTYHSFEFTRRGQRGLQYSDETPPVKMVETVAPTVARAAKGYASLDTDPDPLFLHDPKLSIYRLLIQLG